MELVYAGSMVGSWTYCAYIDARSGIIPDKVILPTAGLAIFLGWFLFGIPIIASVLGFFGGWIILAPLVLLGKVGRGDMKMAGAIGAFLGVGLIVYVVPFALALSWGARRLVSARGVAIERVAMGPFLAITATMMFLIAVLAR